MIQGMGQQVGNVTQDSRGRISGSRGLTSMQRLFVVAFVANGGNGRAAAKAAGYADPDAAQYNLVRSAHVAAAIADARQRKISELATAGLDLLEQVIRGTLDGVKPKERLEASKFVINLAGHVAPKAADGDTDDDKPLEEMTIQELEDFVRRGEEAAKRAKQPIIDGAARELVAPDTAPDGAEVIDVTPESTV